MGRLRRFLTKYIFPESLPLTAKIVYIICLAGVIATLAAVVTRILMFPGPSVILAVFGIVLSVLILCLFFGVLILLRRRIARQEDLKADMVRKDAARQAKFLWLVNEAAALLLSSDTEQFEETLGKCMKMITGNMKVDRIQICKNSRDGEKLYYTRIFSWTGEDGFRAILPEKQVQYAYDDKLKRWEWFLAEGRCINGPVRELPLDEQELLRSIGIASILVVPVFMLNKFWGFVTFGEFTQERSFPPDEESILRSASLLFANAVMRNEWTQNLVHDREDALAGAKAKSDFLANMSHEIRTPMNAIIGMTNIAISTNDVERKNSCLKKIEDASQHLLGVINDILDLSKIEANKLELSLVSFSFEKMLQRVVNVISFRVDEKKQNFSVHIDRQIPKFLIGDDQRLAQVITNLLGNAVKFTPEGGSIQLDTSLIKEEDGNCLIQIAVIDTGIGITPEQKSRLFTSFGQADSNTSRKFGGTGLGLAISKRIAEMMNGKIWAESEPGKGSTFAFTIEIKRDTEARESSDIGNNWGNLRILAVDDDKYVREYFQALSEQFGVACDVASSGEEALSLLEKHGFYDIYFVDWKMPGMNGIEFSRKMKEQTASSALGTPKPLVTMMTAAEWNAIEEEAREAGVNKFLTKPLFPSAIAECISQCLGINQPPAAAVVPAEAVSFAGRRILLAEDVEINREIVQALLEPTELTIDFAENGAEAVRKYSESPGVYNAILMDVQMPEMDGHEATRRIRALEAERGSGKPGAPAGIPIIAMTANVFREDIERCLACGMDDHVGKPLDSEEVISKLRIYLGRS